MNSKYKVSLYVSRGGFPFWFAVHPWVVIEKNGIVSRWEVGHVKRSGGTNWGHLYLNILPPISGIGIFHYMHNPRWPASLLGSTEGDENSQAYQMVKFIENSENNYPYCSKYSFTGPNSNTYIQWVLNHFPEFKVRLPWNAFGKNYHG